MRKEQFEEIVREAVTELPGFFLDIMHNVDIQVRRWPTRRQLSGAGMEEGETLLGLYVGVPLPDRYDGNMVPPDIITIFQGPIEAICSSRAEVVDEVRDTVVHEVAHYFGITDAELTDWGLS